MDIRVNDNTVIVFDLDDTLYNEINYLKSAYIEIAREVEPNSWEKLYAQIFSMYRHKLDVFKYLVDKYSLDKNDLIQKYRNHKPSIEPFENVIDVFNEIKTKKGKIAIITDGRSVTQRNKLEKLGLLRHIDHLVISEELGTEKPNRQNFEAVELYFKRGTYFYIADNFKKDFVTPKQLGWKTVALLDNGLNIHCNAHTHSSLEFLPEYYINSFGQFNII